MIRVAVAGAAGRMGETVCRAVTEAPDMTLSAMLSTVGRWERCERAYARLRKELDFEIFHANHCAYITALNLVYF